MNRRDIARTMFLLGLSPSVARSQQRMVRIGALSPRRDSIILPPALKRLADLGYVEGKNLELLHRSADGVPARFPQLARELIDAKCDLIFALGAEAAARALVDANTRIPVVLMATDYDPIKSGIVPGLRNPGGTVTGVIAPVLELSAKRLEIMHEILPKANRYLVLSDSFSRDQLDATVAAARAFRVEIVGESFGATPYDLDGAFARGSAARADALIVLVSPVFLDQRGRIFDLAMKHRLPVLSGSSTYGDQGVLMSYSPDFARHWARAGDIAASILGGAKPGDIALEKPTHFELAINLKTAKALGIKIPQSVLLRANRLIE